MRCTIPLQAFFHLIRDCVSLIPARSTMPITGHLLLSATDDHITLTATNLETTVIAQCPAAVSKAGTVTLPGKKLYEILKELSGEELKLSHNAKSLETKLECKSSRVQLIGMPPEEFPAIPSHTATPLFSMPQEHLHRLLSETLPSIGHEAQKGLNTLRVECIPRQPQPSVWWPQTANVSRKQSSPREPGLPHQNVRAMRCCPTLPPSFCIGSYEI